MKINIQFLYLFLFLYCSFHKQTKNILVGPNYAGLLIRLAWHCSGTYRISDGRGGCDGGSIRFPPLSEWADNKSLEQVRNKCKQLKIVRSYCCFTYNERSNSKTIRNKTYISAANSLHRLLLL
jgi:hypothetical protein